MAVFAPIPSASDRIATMANSGVRRNPRIARRRADKAEVMRGGGRRARAKGWRDDADLVIAIAELASARLPSAIFRHIHPGPGGTGVAIAPFIVAMPDAKAKSAPVPAFLTVDPRAPAAVRDLLVEADGC